MVDVAVTSIATLGDPGRFSGVRCNREMGLKQFLRSELGP